MKTNRLGMLSSVLVLVVGCGPALMHGTFEVIAPAKVGTVGSVVQLQARVISPGGAVMDVSHEVAWSVTDIGLGAIGNAGQLRLLAPGNVSVVAKYGNQKVATTIVAIPEKLPALQILPNVENLNVGVQQQFLLFAAFEDGHLQDVTQQTEWSFQGGLIAQTSIGSAIATFAGPATVRASFNGRQVETIIFVKPAADVGYRIEMASGLRVGDEARLALISTAADGSTEDVALMATWTSSNPGTAQIVDAYGAPVLKALKAGFTSLTATVNGVTTAVAVSVFNKPLSKVEFDVSIVDVASGASKKLDVFARYVDGERVHVTTGVTFTSANSAVFTVDRDGVVTGQTPGDSHVWATFEGITAVLDVHVGVARLASLASSVRTIRLAPGTSVELKITGTFTDGQSADMTSSSMALTNGLTYSKLGNPLLVTAESVGTESVLVQANGLETAVIVDVSTVPLVEIRITKDSRDIDNLKMIATARWADGLELDVTELAHWSLDAKTTATISDVAGNRGDLSYSPGSAAVIHATIGKITGTFEIVPPPTQ
jgi:trimeric autotransporter adhesin